MSNNAVLDNILTRRSCRAYTDRPVSKEDLDTILKAAIYAPSGMSRQSWQFTVIRKKENIQELAKVVRETLNRPESYNFYDPDVIILASNEKDNTNGLADCACAMENMFLMAQELGIGSCWINQLKEICDEPQVRAELKKFGVPDNHIVWGIVDLGYAAQEPVCKEKNENVAADLSGLLEGKLVLAELLEEQKGYVDALKTWIAYAHCYDKLMFGTDWPLANYGDYIGFTKAVIPEKHWDNVFYRNAKRIYSL